MGLELLSKEAPQSGAKQTAAVGLGNLGLMCSEGRRAGRLGPWRQEALKRVWCLRPAPFVTQNKTNSNPENKYKEGQFSGLAHDDYFDGVFLGNIIFLPKLFLFSFLGVPDMPATEGVFSLLGGSSLSRSEFVNQRARRHLGRKGTWRHPCITPGALRLPSQPVWQASSAGPAAQQS